MVKRTIIILIAIVTVTVTTFILFMVLCNKEQLSNPPIVRTDIKPIISMFPMLKQTIKCNWESGELYKKKRFELVPGPTPYWIKGYVFCKEEYIKGLLKKYKWEDVDNNLNPLVIENESNLSDAKWLYSEEFNNFLQPGVYYGKIYLNPEYLALYFDLIKD